MVERVLSPRDRSARCCSWVRWAIPPQHSARSTIAPPGLHLMPPIADVSDSDLPAGAESRASTKRQRIATPSVTRPVRW